MSFPFSVTTEIRYRAHCQQCGREGQAHLSSDAAEADAREHVTWHQAMWARAQYAEPVARYTDGTIEAWLPASVVMIGDQLVSLRRGGIRMPNYTVDAVTRNGGTILLWHGPESAIGGTVAPRATDQPTVPLAMCVTVKFADEVLVRYRAHDGLDGRPA